MRITDMSKTELEKEVLNFTQLSSLALPRKSQFPKIEGIDYFMFIEPLKGCVGGDHGMIINYNDYLLEDKIRVAWDAKNEKLAKTLETHRNKVGIVIADVSGKMTTDHLLAFYVDAVVRSCIASDLKHNGELTANSIELINTMVYNLLNVEYLPQKKFVTMLIGEFSGSGRFRYIDAGHPEPKIFSAEYDRIVNLHDDCVQTSTPLGMQPSEYVADLKNFQPNGNKKKKYSVNEVNLLGKGDIMVLYTDGLSEQKGGELNFVRDRLEDVLRESKHETARGIYTAIRQSLQRYYPPDDDLTIAVIKKI